MIESLDCGPNGTQRDSTAHAYFSLVVTKIDAKQKKTRNQRQRQQQHKKTYTINENNYSNKTATI